MKNIISNPLYIALFSITITSILLPLGKILFTYLTTLRKPFTGHYLIVNKDYLSNNLTVEIAKLNQTSNNSIKGTIAGKYVAIKKDNYEYELQDINKSKFEFKGSLENRLITLSYNSILKGVFCAGTMTLKINENGKIISGIWSGLENGKIVSSNCKWYLLEPSLLSDKNKSKLKDIINKLVKFSFPIQNQKISEIVLQLNQFQETEQIWDCRINHGIGDINIYVDYLNQRTDYVSRLTENSYSTNLEYSRILQKQCLKILSEIIMKENIESKDEVKLLEEENEQQSVTIDKK